MIGGGSNSNLPSTSHLVVKKKTAAALADCRRIHFKLLTLSNVLPHWAARKFCNSVYQFEPLGLIPELFMNGDCGQIATRVKP